METVITIKKIGTSRGCIIPAKILKKYHLKENDKIYLNDMENRLELRFTPSSATKSVFEELHAINRLPGDAPSMQEIRKNRNNKADLIW